MSDGCLTSWPIMWLAEDFERGAVKLCPMTLVFVDTLVNMQYISRMNGHKCNQ